MNRPIPPGSVRPIPVSRPAEPLPALSRPSDHARLDPFGLHRASPARTPLIDIHESEEGLVLEADIPGASDKTVTIHLEHNVLHLRAGVENTPENSTRLIQQEFPIADFERTFILSDDVDRTQISADLKHGVLRILLPKAERGRTRRINVRGD